LVDTPDPEIHNKEIIGRRAFGKDKDIFSGPHDDRHYKIDIFTDKRPGGLSVDRMGIGQVVRKRVNGYLDPLGVSMGENRGKAFRGWATVSVTSIHELVEATAAEGEINIWHAEIMRDEHYTTPLAKRALAFQLCTLARQQEFVPSPSQGTEAA